MATQRTVGNYTLMQRILRGDAKIGLPELWRAQDYGDLFYIKLWKRKGEDRADIRAMWNREVRSLMRLQGYPGAAELFVTLQDLNADEKQYYAVLQAGRRNLLSEMLKNRSQSLWLGNLNQARHRRPIWEGMLRIAEALAILHDEGTLHRALSSASIFASPDGNGDFRLSGFEWSLRIAGTDRAAVKVDRQGVIAAPELDRAEGEYSIATDWFDFGLVIAELFGVNVRALRKRESVHAQVTNHRQLNVAEKELILGILEEDHEQRLASSGEITRKLRDIVRNLGHASLGLGRPLFLAVRLGFGSRISKMIAQASQGKAPAGDPEKQLQWMKHDLRGDIRITARVGQTRCFILHGNCLEYRVVQWSVNSVTTWDIGYCDACELFPQFHADDQRYGLGERNLEIRTLPQIHQTVRTVRDQGVAWDRLFPFARERRRLEPQLRDVHDFFRITQQLDTLLAVAQICPVEVMSVERFASETEIVLTPLEEVARNELARSLGLERPSEQLRDRFDLGAEQVVVNHEDDPKSDNYKLLNRKTIDSDGIEVIWRFVGAEPDPKGPRYRFSYPGSVAVREGKAYLARNHSGILSQIRRRYKAIEELGSHENLLRLLDDPQAMSRSVDDLVPQAPANLPLDGAKREALESLWKTRPSFAVQGPPGTGKTTLIQALISRLLSEDPSAQVLITAHSHSTVDHVRRKVSDILADRNSDSPLILVRSGGREETEHDIGPITDDLMARLRESDLYQQAPAFLRERIAAAAVQDGTRDETAENYMRTMQVLVQDAANVTFITSNAPDLENLADRGRRFDWSIIEEAGKAHGFDMAGALQLSHRLLLIGDHFQLSPFNSALFKRLLDNPGQIRIAIQTGRPFAPGLVDTTVVEDDDDRIPLDERCAVWRRMVLLFGYFFTRSQGDGTTVTGPAVTLTDQHRMHPEIAELVGRIYYPDDQGGTILKSPDETHAKFAIDPPFKIAVGSWLPDQRIVWCDIPWVQREEWAVGESDGMYDSPTEATAVVEILEQLRPRAGVACKIQILSPYNDQLRAIRDAVNRAHQEGGLVSMFEPSFDLRIDKRLGTTVDGFQGNEADVVIVSLVRNNGAVPWKSLGFLKESTRVNVLLSRARHKLIVVGSWDFFQSRCDEKTPPDAEYVHIGRMMEQMEEARKSGQLARVEVRS